MQQKTPLQYLLRDSELLFYGELQQIFFSQLKDVLNHIKSKEKNPPYIFDKKESSYWYIISILDTLKLIDYGTSPRFPWLTEKGELLYQEIKNMSQDEFEEIESKKETYNYLERQ